MASKNYEAFGNAWIVGDMKWVDTPNEEIDAIANTDVHNVAIVNKEFATLVGDFEATPAEGIIQLVDYKPNELKYTFDSSKDEMVVFSEIWTSKGWTMYVDGEEQPLLRANYLLRCALIPSGEHEIMMEYAPKAYAIGNKVSFASSLILILGLIGAFIYTFVPKKEKKA